MTECKEGPIVAEHNGQSFRFNELVHVWEGTTPGLGGNDTGFGLVLSCLDPKLGGHTQHCTHLKSHRTISPF